ncbi:MAG: hypothetical protein OXR73_05755, partial [Myxococcales bacterium]|nr:hypothetical protein [Myxococcales bacterium]
STHPSAAVRFGFHRAFGDRGATAAVCEVVGKARRWEVQRGKLGGFRTVRPVITLDRGRVGD